jgi:ribosomal protein S6
MAPHSAVNLSSLQDEEDLSDEQVAALLKEAEDRLRLRKGDAEKSQSSGQRKL